MKVTPDNVMIPIGTPVDVYWNLHKDVFSVRSRLSGVTYGKVIAHVDSFTLRDVKFVVNESGRQRVLRERRKNVHAFVRGCWAEPDSHEHFTGFVWRVRYNPYEGDSFTRVSLAGPVPTQRADMASGLIQYKRPLLFVYCK